MDLQAITDSFSACCQDDRTAPMSLSFGVEEAIEYVTKYKSHRMRINDRGTKYWLMHE